ncbi:MAG: hypothetical protein ACE5E5_16490 [Phycisphaerae bacterium]
MNDDKHDETPQPQAQRLLHWDRIDWVTMNRHIQARDPTRTEWVIGTTVAHAVAVADAACSGDDAPPDVRQVIAVVAERINAGMLDHTILLLRDTLKYCIRRGDSSLFAANSPDEEDMDCVVG